jgi:hypothetical protein
LAYERVVQVRGVGVDVDRLEFVEGTGAVDRGVGTRSAVHHPGSGERERLDRIDEADEVDAALQRDRERAVVRRDEERGREGEDWYA